jgi:hypothetical protein
MNLSAKVSKIQNYTKNLVNPKQQPISKLKENLTLNYLNPSILGQVPLFSMGHLFAVLVLLGITARFVKAAMLEVMLFWEMAL